MLVDKISNKGNSDLDTSVFLTHHIRNTEDYIKKNNKRPNNFIQNNNRMHHKRLHLFANRPLSTINADKTFSNISQEKSKHLLKALLSFLFSDNRLLKTSKMVICSLMFIVSGLYSNQAKAQNCTTLYIITGNDGKVYSVNTATGAKTLVTTMTSGKENLAVGPDPASLGTTVYTTSQISSGSTVYKTNASISTTIPVAVGGLTANPATTGSTAGFVYGISSARQLIKASPAPAANLGIITGDAIWSGATIAGDGFFNNANELFTVVTSGSSQYLYKINTTTLVATQAVQLSGTLPGAYHGLAFLNSRIYAGEAFTQVNLLSKTNKIQLYEINPNTGQSVKVGLVDLGTTGSILGIGGTSYPDIDFATCDVFVPATGPTCNELFGIVATTQSVYRIDLTTLATTLVTAGTATSPTQGNVAFGPVPANLNQNQFVTSPNNASGNIYKDVNGAGTLSITTSTWGTPIGLGTDPATGIVYGINSKVLTKWIGSGNGALVGSTGTITGDATWTAGTTLNDIAVDAGGNLYCIIFNGANTYLYRVNPTTLTAKLVVQATGAFITNGTTTNGNGLAYMGDYFYYSRINGANTDIWKISACSGGVSTYVGSVTGLNFGDLASCATVTCVPANFNFDCSATGAGLQNGNLAATGASQSNILRVPINTTITGLAGFTLAGTGITTSPSPYIINLEQGATFVDIPFTYDGLGAAGNRTITVTSSVATGTCSITIAIDPCAAGTTAPTLSATTKSNTCPATTIDLSTIVATNTPVGARLEWHTATPVSITNKVADSSKVAAGTYYAVFYDVANNCYSNISGTAGSTAVVATSNVCIVPTAGTIDCSKTQIFTAPVVGIPGQKTLIVTINVTSPGCFTPIAISGSGMTPANNITQVCTATTGIQTFSIPVNYDGTTLGTMNFTIGTLTNAGTCSADLTKTPKKAISDVWTLDCVPTAAPSLK
jgi:hypothetical protein